MSPFRVTPSPKADLLVLAGNIDHGLEGVRRFARWPVPVLYVMGSREYHHLHYDQLRAELHSAMQRENWGSVQVLDAHAAQLHRFHHWSRAQAAAIQQVRIFGCTLWADYNHPDVPLGPAEQLLHADWTHPDHQQIGYGSQGRFSAARAAEAHWKERLWLERELRTPFDGKTVVVTHHAPHRRSTPLHQHGSGLHGAAVSHLPELVEMADLWIHGGIRHSLDYTVAKPGGLCRVVANPRGHWRDSLPPHHGEMAENPQFDPSWVVELECD